MRHAARLFGGLALALLLALAARGTAQPQADDKAIAALIEQLGDEEFDTRKAAEKKLAALGEAVLEPLRKTAREHADADVRLRAIVLMRAIEKASFGQIRTFTGHTNHIRSIAVSKDGKRALTGGMDNLVRLWDLDSGKELKTLTGHGGWAWSVVFSPDEGFALSSGALDKTLRLWSLADGKEVRQFTGHTKRAYGAAFTPDGKRVLSGGADDADDLTVRIYDTDSGKELHRLAGHGGWVWRVVVSPDGKLAASAGCNDKTFRLWDLETAKERYVGKDAHDGFVVGVAFSPDGKRLLSAGRDATVKLWEVATGKLLRTYTGLGDNAEAIAFSPDGKRFLAGENKIVHVFDTETGKIIHRFEEHTGYVYAVAFLPDGRHALSAGEDNLLRLWGVPR